MRLEKRDGLRDVSELKLIPCKREMHQAGNGGRRMIDGKSRNTLGI